MAKALLPYYHARRAPENKKGDTVPPLFYTHPPLEETIERNCDKNSRKSTRPDLLAFRRSLLNIYTDKCPIIERSMRNT